MYNEKTNFAQQNNFLPLGTPLKGGKYIVRRILGHGGFGVTYLCEDTVNRIYVAVKEFFPSTLCNRNIADNSVLVATSSNVAIVERLRVKFQKEARVIAKLSSPYIVHIHDTFEENDTSYYSMDYVEGNTLADIVMQYGPMPVAKAFEYISKIGDALSHIHSSNTNHLDVKPANIMLRRADDTPILIDFGLSKQYDSSGNQTSTTPVGISDGYAPIEQYNQGGVSNFSPQTDLYSLAATFYYLITGSKPANANVVAEYGIKFPTNFPAELKGPITKAMAMRRADRHSSVREFISELGKAIGGKKGGEHEKKTGKLILIITLFVVLIAGGITAYLILNDKHYDYDYYDESSYIDQPTTEEEEEILTSDEEPAEVVEVQPVSTDSIANNSGINYDAKEYFAQYARIYGNGSSFIYRGYIVDNQGEHPINLKFNIDNDGNPYSCSYENVNYGNGYQIPMSVSFTSDRMYLTGSYSGQELEIKVTRGRDGKWSGYATLGTTEKPCYLVL
ncbi:MAG: serine/threonine protein kinase [Muribaculaceae bacterium]|nr:serine/threonine protein kinase [Muribaculaceae bacterium]